MRYSTMKCIEAFMEQIETDYDFIEDFIRRHNFKVIACGRHLLEKNVYYPYILPPGIKYKDEFLDFIDGNGFKVVQHGSPNMFRIYPIIKNTK